MARRARPRQPHFSFATRRKYVRRPGSRTPGRPPKRVVAGVSHLTRPALQSHVPVHVTLRLSSRLPSLRRPAERAAIFASFRAGKERFGFRLIHASIQVNHLHLVVEAKDRRALSRGMRGLAIRIARALNRLWRRSGPIFNDRYHATQLRTPRAVRNGLAYVLLNHRRHGSGRLGPDPYSTGSSFEGWKDWAPPGHAGPDRREPATTAPRTWLLSSGWQRWRLIGIREVPGVSIEEWRRGLPRT